jgi:GNAT superfamily N-acetyltransferase
VRPDRQRKGIGSALLSRITCTAEECGATHLSATTLVDTPAAAFYLKHGFQSAGAVPYNPKKHNFEKTLPTGTQPCQSNDGATTA